MAIYGEGWAVVESPGGSGATSNSLTMRWPRAVNVKAQVAISGLGTGGGVVEVGVSSFTQSGQQHPVGDNRYGTWAPVFFWDGITELEISARSYDAWVLGGATVMLWD